MRLDRTETFIYSLVCLGACGTEASSLHGSQEAKKIKNDMGMVTHACNPNTGKDKAGRLPQV